MSSNKPLTINISPQTIFVAFAVVVFSLLVLKLTDIIVLIFVSLVFAAALHPSVLNIQRRFKVPKWAAITAIYVLVVLITVLIVMAVVPAVSSQIDSLTNNLPDLKESIVDSFHNNPSIQTTVENLLNKISENSGQIATNLASATLGIFATLFGFITVMILSAYFVSGGKPMIEQALVVLPDKSWAKRILDIIARISRKLGYWLRGQLVLCFIIFVATYVGLTLLGVDYALTIALLSGLLETIPTFGAFISGTIAMLMGLTISPSKAIAVAVLYLLINLIQGHIITPQVMRRALGVPAVMIIISLLVFGKLFGLIGVLLAAPMAAVTVLLIEEFAPETKRFIERAAKKQTNPGE